MRRRASHCCTSTLSKIPGIKQTSHAGKNDPRMSIAGALAQPARLHEAKRSQLIRPTHRLGLMGIILKAP
jgi:hypothetical protein